MPRRAASATPWWVDRHDEPGSLLSRESYDFRRQPVAEPETVRNEIRGILVAEPAQAAQYQRRAGRTVGIEIADHHDARAIFEMAHHELDACLQPVERAHGQQAIEPELELIARAETASRIDAA